MNPAVIARRFASAAHVVFKFLCPDLDVLCRRFQDTPFENRFTLVAFRCLGERFSSLQIRR